VDPPVEAGEVQADFRADEAGRASDKKLFHAMKGLRDATGAGCRTRSSG
jgi:hypothetical protein